MNAAPAIRDAVTEPDVEAVRELFLEYQAAIGAVLLGVRQ
jgi:hypothetical protein